MNKETQNKNPQDYSKYDLALMQRRLEENSFEEFSAEAEFNPKIGENIFELAKNVKPETSVFNYQQAIVKSLSETIDPKLSIYDFWEELNKKNCKKLIIDQGRLEFFDEKGQKIDIQELTKGMTFEAHTDAYKVKQELREAEIAKIKEELQKLKTELQK